MIVFVRSTNGNYCISYAVPGKPNRLLLDGVTGNPVLWSHKDVMEAPYSTNNEASRAFNAMVKFDSLKVVESRT